MRKHLTKVNFNRVPNKQNLFIVVHYTGNNGDTAMGNAKYFHSVDRGASAHYFIDENEIVQVVEDKNVSWHCGAKKYMHKTCRNYNSIGVEMCSRKDSKGNYYIKHETVKHTEQLVRELMKKYNIPQHNVLRHYDVTGKHCPKPMVVDNMQWIKFKANLGGGNMTVAEATKIVQEKAQLGEKTMEFLQAYKYGEDLIIKLAKAMQ